MPRLTSRHLFILFFSHVFTIYDSLVFEMKNPPLKCFLKEDFFMKLFLRF